MKIYRDIEQQTKEWFEIRKGKITSTTLEKVLGITKKRDPKWHAAAFKLLAETHLDMEDEFQISKAQVMVRWNMLEPVAKEAYEEFTWMMVEEVWFIEKNSYLWLSPDGIINTNTRKKPKYTRAVEIKCPLGPNFMKFVIQNKIPDKYMWQVLNYFLVIDDLITLDFVVYHPWASGKIPKLFIITVTRSDLAEMIEKAKTELAEFRKEHLLLEGNLFNQSENMLWKQIDDDKYYKVQEVAEILGLKRATVNKKCRDWELVCSNSWTKKRGKYLIKWSDILDFINE